MRHYEHLKSTRVQQVIYEQSTEPGVIKASIREVIATLDEQIAQVEREIRQHFDDHPDLKRKRDLLTSIPGIGETTAGSLLAEIPHLDRFESAKAVAAYAGLSPRHRLSGTSIHGRSRLCKTGNSRLRKALYMPAIVALRFNPVLRVLPIVWEPPASTSAWSSAPSCVSSWFSPMGFFGQASDLTRITLDDEYGIYPRLMITASRG
jgi:transposase